MPQTEQPSTSVKSRVMLVEDHPVVRYGLANLIDDEPDLMVCGGAGSIKEALQLMEKIEPDVAVVDIVLGDENGLDLIKQLHETRPEMPILALSMHDESLYAERALRAGAKGYVMKKEAMDDVMGAIRRVLTGEIYVSDSTASRMVRKFLQPGESKTASPMEALSDREFEVFNLIAKGVGPTEIAERLSVSVKTVETHRVHIKKKLALKSGRELTRFAVEWKLSQG